MGELIFLSCHTSHTPKFIKPACLYIFPGNPPLLRHVKAIIFVHSSLDWMGRTVSYKTMLVVVERPHWTNTTFATSVMKSKTLMFV